MATTGREWRQRHSLTHRGKEGCLALGTMLFCQRLFPWQKERTDHGTTVEGWEERGARGAEGRGGGCRRESSLVRVRIMDHGSGGVLRLSGGLRRAFFGLLSPSLGARVGTVRR